MLGLPTDLYASPRARTVSSTGRRTHLVRARAELHHAYTRPTSIYAVHSPELLDRGTIPGHRQVTFRIGVVLGGGAGCSAVQIEPCRPSGSIATARRVAWLQALDLFRPP